MCQVSLTFNGSLSGFPTYTLSVTASGTVICNPTSGVPGSPGSNLSGTVAVNPDPLGGPGYTDPITPTPGGNFSLNVDHLILDLGTPLNLELNCTFPVPTPTSPTSTGSCPVYSGDLDLPDDSAYVGYATITVAWTPTIPAVVGIDLSHIPSDWTPLISDLTDKKGNPVGPPQFVIADAWGGSNQFPAFSILSSAPAEITNKAAYAVLSYGDLTGDEQINRALAAVGDVSLGFMAVDVECDLNISTQLCPYDMSGNFLPDNPDSVANRNRTIAQAIQAVQDAGLKPVIYTNAAYWSEVTGGTTSSAGKGTDSFECIPLWHAKDDNIATDLDNPKKDVAGPYSLPFGKWTTRVGKQYSTEDPQFVPGGTPQVDSDGKPLKVDLDVFDPSVFTPGVSCTTNPQGCMAEDVSSSVTAVRGLGRIINPAAPAGTPKIYQQPIRVTNITGNALPGPISLVFDNLDNATVANGAAFPLAGFTRCTYPASSAYVDVAPGGLAAGQPVTAIMQYTLAPGTEGPMFTIRVLGGNGTR